MLVPKCEKHSPSRVSPGPMVALLASVGTAATARRLKRQRGLSSVPTVATLLWRGRPERPNTIRDHPRHAAITPIGTCPPCIFCRAVSSSRFLSMMGLRWCMSRVRAPMMTACDHSPRSAGWSGLEAIRHQRFGGRCLEARLMKPYVSRSRWAFRTTAALCSRSCAA
jgi:hypothetical protein